MTVSTGGSRIGVSGLAVMGANLARNIARPLRLELHQQLQDGVFLAGEVDRRAGDSRLAGAEVQRQLANAQGRLGEALGAADHRLDAGD